MIASVVRPLDMLDGALQSFMTFEPYLDQDFAAEARAVFQERAGR